ncbi:MAG TPA: hypothetical protein VHE35_16655, partial [Kofleriaceae bacterium]|nr:hypothetical protein [Kofleriaceae bacterium]
AGADGAIGAMGPAGPAGANGLDGATGPMGPQGPAGVNGLDGATGPMGPQGPAGVNGLDGATGPMGPQGPAGLNGLDGATGPMGPQGPAGLNGIDGINGLDGAVGPMGPQGPAGQDGLDGATGPMGPQGPAGPQGLSGVVMAQYVRQLVASGSSGVWNDVLGASYSFDLDAMSTVDFQADGTLIAYFGADATAHCGLRFLVDGAPISGSQFGDRAIGCDRIDPASTERWCPWTARQFAQLAPGPHTVSLQITGDADYDALCSSPTDDAFAAKLWVFAH